MMKATIAVLVLFIVTKRISCENAGNSTASNETILSTTAKPFFKKVIDFFTGSGNTEKANSSLAKAEGNSTLIPSTGGSSTYNITTEQPTRSSTRTTAKTTGTTKPKTTITAKESGSTAKEKEDGLKKTTPKSEENSTAEDSFARNATHDSEAEESEISERALLTTIASGEQDVLTTEEEDSNPSATNEEPLKEETESPSQNDNAISPKEDEEHPNSNDTNVQPDPQQHKEYCTNYIRELVSLTLTKHADQLDPLPLPDRKLEFEAPFLLSTARGRVGFHDGKVTGISQGRPIDECNVETRGDQIRLVSGIYIDEALINYKGSATLLQFGPRITVDGKLSGILAGLRIVFPQEGGRGRIEEFRVTRVKGIEVDIKGLGVIDWSVEFISERAAKVFLSTFRRSMERDLRKALEEEITEISYP